MTSNAFLVILAVLAILWGAVLLPRFVRSLIDRSWIPLAVGVVICLLYSVVPIALDPNFYHSVTTRVSPPAALSGRVAQDLSWVVLACLVLTLIAVRRILSSVGIAGLALMGALAISSLLNGQTLAGLLVPVAVVGLAGIRQTNTGVGVLIVRAAFRVLIFASVWLWLFNQAAAFMNVQNRELLGIQQLAGATSHPNVMGPVAAVAIVLELATLSRRNLLSWAALVAAVACNIFAQSRSGWLMAAVGVCLLWVWASRSNRVARGGVLALAGAVVLWNLISTGGDLDGTDITDGRLTIWSILLARVAQSPLIGGGINVLSVDNRQDLGSYASAVGQAHNQFLQTLLDSGAIGLLALAGFIVAVVIKIRLLDPRWKGLGTSVAVMLLLLMFSESPLRPSASGFQLILLLLVSMLSADAIRPWRDGLETQSHMDSRHPSQQGRSLAAWRRG